VEPRAESQAAAPPPPGADGVAGWYPDPWSPTRRRYWTGASWTFSTTDVVQSDEVAPRPVAPPPTVDVGPVPAPPPPDEAPAQARPAAGLERDGAASGWAARARNSPPVVLAVVLGLFLGIAGAAVLFRSSPSTPPPGAGGSAAGRAPATAPSPPSGSTDPSTTALSSVVVRQADVARSVTVALLPGGAGLGRPTMDLCNGTFPSEARRTARLQNVAIDGTGEPTLSTEAVLYAGSGGATQALSEVKAVAAACPPTPVASPVDDPTVITTLGPPPDGDWPQTPSVSRVAFDVTTDDGADPPTHSLAVYLQRGRALLGVYFFQPDAPQAVVAGQTTVGGIVGVFASRLAALPTSVVGS
jgi:hypothetical protein